MKPWTGSLIRKVYRTLYTALMGLFHKKSPNMGPIFYKKSIKTACFMATWTMELYLPSKPISNTLPPPSPPPHHPPWKIKFVIFVTFFPGEQGAVGMFPLYLVDHGIPASEVTMWTGVIGQGLSIAGSLFGGWLLSSSKRLVFFIHLFIFYLFIYLFFDWGKTVKLEFSSKITNITQTPVSCENAFKKSKNPLAFLCKTIARYL